MPGVFVSLGVTAPSAGSILEAQTRDGLSLYIPVSSGGLFPGSTMGLYGTVSKSSLGSFRADKNGVFVGQLAIPAGTESGPLKLVAFGTNKKKQPVVMPFTVTIKIPQVAATTTTSAVGATTSSLVTSDSSVMQDDVKTSDSSSSFPWWLLIAGAFLVGVALVAVRRRVARDNNSTI
jgi:hypothetical protein